MNGLLLLYLISLSCWISSENKENTLQVKIDKIEHEGGEMIIALYNREDTYMSKNVYKYASVKVNDLGPISVEFESLPPGSYSICIFHDLNSNGKLDKNIIGIPTEPYGFSNNPKLVFGPPDFESTKFRFKSGKNRETIIHLK